ncbi:hypothetical protein AB447_208960 [Bacillus glycinifermentans]|uniref:Uncharacterized protein n=1 Tax=Bacillus glycinifermentans TaxID=1664069 RepID=A0A0T6BI71_9BACI|nr:hypothetical protein AB447_208960 [Bacillus glycinifermentans]
MEPWGSNTLCLDNRKSRPDTEMAFSKSLYFNLGRKNNSNHIHLIRLYESALSLLSEREPFYIYL